MPPASVTKGSRASALVLTCEHATSRLPEEYGGLGLGPRELAEHIAWDIGAAAVSRHLAEAFDAPAVESGYSRLLIDCNRDLADHDLIVEESHGVAVPGNRALEAEEREGRVRRFYAPYHDAVDDVLAASTAGSLLLSVHSFTPVLGDQARDFDVGVLYDDHAGAAERFAAALGAQSLAVRHNEPYSGFDGLIHSARTHGRRHGLVYLEIEINNRLLRRQQQIAEVSERIAAALRGML